MCVHAAFHQKSHLNKTEPLIIKAVITTMSPAVLTWHAGLSTQQQVTVQHNVASAGTTRSQELFQAYTWIFKDLFRGNSISSFKITSEFGSMQVMMLAFSNCSKRNKMDVPKLEAENRRSYFKCFFSTDFSFFFFFCLKYKTFFCLY